VLAGGLNSRRFDPIAALATVVEEEAERIARLWAKRLRVELHEVELPGREVRGPLLGLVRELGRLLTDRGDDAVRLWPEVLRGHGAARYDLRFEPEDLARELKALHQVLLRVYVRRRGTLEPETAEFLTELMGEAAAALQSSFARVLRTEEVRLREAAVMESVLQNVDVGILVAELNGQLSYATPPVSRLMGLPPRVFVGAGVDGLRAVLAQLDARHLGGEPFRAADLPYVRALKEKREIRGVVVAIKRHPDGREVILEMTAHPVWDETGKELFGVVQTLVDRSETTQKTRELGRAYDQLRRLQAELLQRSRTQALAQLASGVAHALNNFLNVVRLRLTLAKRDPKPGHLESLEKTVGSLSQLVERLQDFSAERAAEQVAEVPFFAAIREGIELARPDLEAHRGRERLSVELLGEPWAKVDPAAVRDLVLNLLLASSARIGEGGQIEIRGSEEGGTIELWVQAQGGAYAEDEVARLFDPLKGRSPAPHLALLLGGARSQLQRWGGELNYQPQGEGKGAFWLKLPAAGAKVPEPPLVQPHPLPRPTHPGQRQVLVVDDDPENARMLAEVLSDEGYEVYVAHNRDDALRTWERHEFDAALLDAVMPDTSGWALAREFRARSPGALLAMVTGADVRGQSRENLALVDAVFRKPVELGALDDFLAQEAPAPGGTLH
jgi:two-component system, cell cycle sensor histidine kinase and response regulator CckA